MLTALMLTTLTLAAAPVPAHALDQPQAVPIKVWLNKKNNVKVGDRVKVYARAESDGYLLVLHAEPDGRIRVLFPLDPTDDNFIRGGQDYELRGRGDREAFRVFATSGLGTVYAAFSRDPFQWGDFVRADHWDYRILEQWRLTEDLDPEAELTALAQAMAGGVGFQYDIAYYGVGENVAYYGGGSTTYVSAGYGWGYYPSWSFSFGWGWPSSYWGWYDPWYYGYYWPAYYYRPYYYYPYSYAYYPYYPYYPGYGGGYYPGYGGWPTYPSGSQYRGKYTFKDRDRYDLARGGIGGRRPSTSVSGPVLRSDLGGRYAADLGGRRAAPGAQSTFGRAATTSIDGRRVSPTADRATGRALTPATAATAGRRTVAPTGADAARTQPRTSASGREVKPSGWGITDGRRVVPATPRQPQGETGSAAAPARRPTTVTPDRSTAPNRSVTPERAPTPNRTVTPQRSTTPNRSATPQRAPTPQRSTPTLERRTPQRSATPQRSPIPQRSAPRPSATQRAPRPSTSRAPAAAPRPSAPRPSSPGRVSSPPSRSSSPPRSSGGGTRRPGGRGHN